MHARLATGMSPAEVADKLAAAVRRGDGLYLLTDHDWDGPIRQRQEAIAAGTAGEAAAAGAAGEPR